MGDITAIVSVLNLLGLGGLGLFLYYVVKGLKERVANLTELAKEQKGTLEAVRTRAVEMDRLSKDYKQALLDFQEMGRRLDERRNELVAELELANKRKDQELARLAHLELEAIELKKKSLERLPELERKLSDAVGELSSQIRIVFPSSLLRFPTRSRDELYRNLLVHSWSNRLADDEPISPLYFFLSSYLHEAAHSYLHRQSSDRPTVKPSRTTAEEQPETEEEGKAEKPDQREAG